MALQKIIDQVGSQAELARIIGVEPMAITHWLKRGIPARRAIELSKLFNIELDDLIKETSFAKEEIE